MARLPKSPAAQTKHWEEQKGVAERALARTQTNVDRAAANVVKLEERLHLARTKLDQATATRDAAVDRHENALAELAALRE